MKIQTVSREGTGTYGTSSSPLSITFSFVPIIAWADFVNWSDGRVELCGNNSSSSFSSYVANRSVALTTSFQKSCPWWYHVSNTSTPSTSIYGKKSSNGKTIYWYGSTSGGYPVESPSEIFNASGDTYYFTAIG